MKKFISISLIIGSSVLAFLIFLGARDIKTNQQELGSPLAQSVSKTASVLTAGTPVLPVIRPTEEPNATDYTLTKQAAERALEEFLSSNNENTPSPEEFLTKVISTELENMDYSDLNPVISESRLKIIENPNPIEKDIYARSIRDIFEEYFNKTRPYFASDPSTFNAEYFAALRKIQAETVTQMYNVPIPKNFLGTHREQLRLLSIQERAFLNMQNYEQDPLRAMVAAYAFQESGKQMDGLVQALSNANNVQ